MQGITSVVIPAGVYKIGWCAFDYCKGLKKVILPDSITEICKGAFSNCPSLTEVEFPDSYESICTSKKYYDMAGLIFKDDCSPWFRDKYEKLSKQEREAWEKEHHGGGACYIATAVYGSYDCPQVWMLRRYRDYTLAKTWYGRAFIRTYYAVSPMLVKWFGHTKWFKKFWRGKLDRMIRNLNAKGVENTPYKDRMW